jgi:hypothetical protein
MANETASGPTMKTYGLAANGPYIDLGGLWVKYDTIGTIKPTDKDEGEPACLVVLTIPGYKTLRVACSANELLTVITIVGAGHEFGVGEARAKGMRQPKD